MNYVLQDALMLFTFLALVFSLDFIYLVLFVSEFHCLDQFLLGKIRIFLAQSVFASSITLPLKCALNSAQNLTLQL